MYGRALHALGQSDESAQAFVESLGHEEREPVVPISWIAVATL